MLPQTFVSLRAFGPELINQSISQFAARVPVIDAIEPLLDLQLPSGSNEPDDDGEIGALDVIGFTQLSASFDGTQVVVQGTLEVLEGFEPTLPVPGLPQLSFVITQLGRVELTVSPDRARIYVTGPSLALRFDRSWLAPANPSTPTAAAEIELVEIGWFSIDTDGAFEWGALPGGDLRFVTNNDPWIIGDTGVTLETGELRIVLENGPRVELDHAILRFSDDLSSKEPEGFALALTGARIDRSGFTGSASVRFEDTRVDNPDAPTTFLGSGAGSLFDLDFGVYAIEVDIRENTPVKAEIRGGMILPFFEKAVDCTVMIGEEGEFEVALAGTGGAALGKLKKDGLLELALTGFGISRVDRITTFTISGSLEFLNKPDQISTQPKFSVQNLSVNSRGEVRLEKAWVDFNPAFSVELAGFVAQFYRVGVSFIDGDTTVFITGVVGLVNGIQAGFEELSVTYHADETLSMALKGASIDATIGGQVALFGRVAMLNDGDIEGFEGDLALVIIKPGIVIEGALKTGVDKRLGYAFFYCYVNVEFPTPIVVMAGLGIFGFAGLLGINVEPAKEKTQHWYYDWYRGPPAPGITQTTKWRPKKDKFAFGAGITFGTVDGYTIVARALIVVTSDLLLFEGRAGFLTERANLSENPTLRLLVVFEPGVSLFIAIEAQYEFVQNVLFAQGVVEAFFPFDDNGDWYVYLGQDEPASKRIVADVLKRLFRADAYVMIDSNRTHFGGGIGYALNKKFGPVRVEVRAGMLGWGDISYSPLQLSTGLQLGGALKLRAFGAGIIASLYSEISVAMSRPWTLSMAFEAEMSLPWPLPDPHVEFEVTWSRSGQPRYPAIITGAAAVGNTGANNIAFFEGETATMVPLDARLAIEFAHIIKKPTDGFQRVLNLPTRNVHAITATRDFTYTLEAMTLERVEGDTVLETFTFGDNGEADEAGIWANWQILKGTADTSGDDATRTPKATGGTLLLMARSPFAWTRTTWQEWNGTTPPAIIPTYEAVPEPDVPEMTIDLCVPWGSGTDWTPSDGETSLGDPDPTLPTRTTLPNGAIIVVHGFPQPGSDDGGPMVYTDPTGSPFGVDIEFPKPVDIIESTPVPSDKPPKDSGPGDDEKPAEPPSREPPADTRCRRCWVAMLAGVLLTALALFLLLLFCLGRLGLTIHRGPAVYVLLVVLLALFIALVWWLVYCKFCCGCCSRLKWRWPTQWRWPRRDPKRDSQREPRKPEPSIVDKRVGGGKQPGTDAAQLPTRTRIVTRAATSMRRRRGLYTTDRWTFKGEQLQCGSITYVYTDDQRNHDRAVQANSETAVYGSEFIDQVSQMFTAPAFVLAPASTYRLTCSVRKRGRDDNDEDVESHAWRFSTLPTAPKSLAPYVFENLPGGTEIPLFRSDPVATVLIENYVREMYETAAETPIELVVVSARGVRQTGRLFEWRKIPRHVDREGELAFVTAVTSIYGAAFAADAIPGDDVLVSYAEDSVNGIGVFEPGETYDAIVRFTTDAEAQSPLHLFRFFTSRFYDIADWAASLDPNVLDFANPAIPDAAWDGAAPLDVDVLDLVPLLKEPLPESPTLRRMTRADGRPMFILTAPEPLPVARFNFVLCTLPAQAPPVRERAEIAVSFAETGPQPIAPFQSSTPVNAPVNPFTRLRLSLGSILADEDEVNEASGVIPAQVVPLTVRWLKDGTRAFLTPSDATEMLVDPEYDLEIRYAHTVPGASGECVVDTVVHRLTMP